MAEQSVLLKEVDAETGSGSGSDECDLRVSRSSWRGIACGTTWRGLRLATLALATLLVAVAVVAFLSHLLGRGAPGYSARPNSSVSLANAESRLKQAEIMASAFARSGDNFGAAAVGAAPPPVAFDPNGQVASGNVDEQAASLPTTAKESMAETAFGKLSKLRSIEKEWKAKLESKFGNMPEFSGVLAQPKASKRVNITYIEDHKVPQEDLMDGNICGDDEEVFGKFCYKRCSLLTSALYPIRTAAWACCRSHPCGLFNQKVNMGICSGFDVSGDAAGKGCPHAPGACYADEEIYLGMCYKKCAILTQNEYPYRTAAATCCKSTSKIGCLIFTNARTSKTFVTGGETDGDESTPRWPHKPLQSLTEKKYK